MLTVPSVATIVGGTDINATRQLTPASGTYALLGHISEASGVASLTAWVSASRIDPGSTWLEYFRRVPSTGATYGDYLIRLPKVTGYTGNRMKVTWSDQADPPDEPFKHVMYEATITPPAGTSLTRNISMVTGGKITGTIHDSDGNLVPGVTVWAVRKAFDPSFGEIAWTGGDSWWTHTKADGTYEIGGLPAGTDYKVNVYPDYNPGMALPIKYKDYNRRTYRGQPLVDSLNTSVGAAVSDHTPVGVALGGTTASIDETIFPGGYVALHADGPEYPTGAVWCDVMYLYKSHWFEIDSGYTTGGTFQKISKVLPTGHYKLMYSDYFKRGSGTWEFDLGPLEHKYASVLVPAPVTIESGGSMLKGAFAGLLGGGSGLPLGGSGGTLLNFKLGSVQTTWSPLPSGTFTAGSVFNATLSSGEASGTWTLTLPYDPAVADGDVPYLRVIHYKQSGGTETLSPIGVEHDQPHDHGADELALAVPRRVQEAHRQAGYADDVDEHVEALLESHRVRQPVAQAHLGREVREDHGVPAGLKGSLPLVQELLRPQLRLQGRHSVWSEVQPQGRQVPPVCVRLLGQVAPRHEDDQVQVRVREVA